MQIMPVAFSIFFFFFPAGLVLYSLCNNILSIAQQWQITRMLENKAEAEEEKKSKGKGRGKGAAADETETDDLEETKQLTHSGDTAAKDEKDIEDAEVIESKETAVAAKASPAPAQAQPKPKPRRGKGRKGKRK